MQSFPSAAHDIVVTDFNIPPAADMSTLPMIAIYANPKDYPGEYIARLWHINQPTAYITRSKTLAAARASIPAGMFNIGRNEKDDATIVEVWL